MWRNIIYPQIDYIRIQLSTSKDEDVRRNLSQQLDTIILGHLGRIGHMISCFTEGKREAFESGAFLNNEFNDKQRKLLVWLLTFSGDLGTLIFSALKFIFFYLVRYRCSYNNSFSSYDHFQSAKEFYELGHRIDTADGSIFNQLAVIESFSPKKSVPMMIYLYSRALGSIDPFPIAKENLSRLLKKFGSLFNGLLVILEGEEMNFEVEFEKMFKNYPGEEYLLYAAALAIGSFSNVNIPKVDCDKSTSEMAILNHGTLTEDTDTLNFDFLSTLIGSSFIPELVQEEILKLFNGNDKSSQHEVIQLPLSL